MVSNPFSNGLSVQIDADTSGFESGISGAMSKLGDFRTEVGLAGAAIGTAFAAGTAKAISAAGDFDAAMTESLAIMGDVSDEMRSKMEKTARTVANETQFSAEEAAESYFFLASAGLDAAESVDALDGVARFAQAGMFDMAQATDILTDANSALGRETEEMVGLGDQLVKANTLANASVEQFGEALSNKAAPAMKRMGVRSEEGVAALATFADQGLKGRRAGTIFARTLEGLEKQARNNSEEFEELGVRVFDADGEMRNLADITADMEGALGDMSTEQKQAALEQMGFNQRAMQGIDLLMGNSEQLREYEGELGNAGGTAQEVADKQMNTFNQQMGLLKDQITDVGISIGQQLLPPLTTLMGHVSTAVEVFARWNEKTNGMLGVVTLVGGAIAGFAVAIAALTPILATVATGIAAVTGAILALNPVTLAIIGVVVALAAAWKTNFLGIRDITHSVVSAIRGAISGFLGWLRPIWNRHMGDIAAEFKRTVAVWRDTISAFISWAQPYIDAFLGFVSGLWQSHGDTVMAIVDTLFGAIARIVKVQLGIMRDVIVAMLRLARGDFEGAAQAITSIVDRLVSAVVDLFKWLSRTLVGNSVVPNMLAAMLSAFKGFASSVTSLVKNTLSAIVSTFTSGLSAVVSTVTSGMSSVRSAITAGMRAAHSMVTSAMTGITSTVNRAFGAFVSTVSSGMSRSKAAISSGVSTMVSTVRGAVGSFRSAGSSLASGLASGIRSKMGSVRSAASSLASAAKSRVSGIASSVSSKVKSATSSVRSRLPSLDTGGFIERDGLAMVHAGEMVVPAADVNRRSGGGGGGNTIDVGGIDVTIQGDASRQDVKRGVSDALRSINATR